MDQTEHTERTVVDVSTPSEEMRTIRRLQRAYHSGVTNRLDEARTDAHDVGLDVIQEAGTPPTA